MTWTARLTLKLLFALLTMNAIADGAADHPWEDSATAEAFMGCLVDSLAKSGYMTPDDMDTIQLLASTMKNGAEIKEKSGGDSPKKLEALNVGLGAGLAEIVSSKGKGNIAGATAVVKNAMINSFMQTTGYVNQKFINEILELIQMFSEDQELPNYSGQSVAVSQNGPSSFGSGPQRSVWSGTEPSVPAEFTQGQKIVGPQGSFGSKESSTSINTISGSYGEQYGSRFGLEQEQSEAASVAAGISDQGGYDGTNSINEAGERQGGGESAAAVTAKSGGENNYDPVQAEDRSAAVNAALSGGETDYDQKGYEPALANAATATESGGEPGYNRRGYSPGWGNYESAAAAATAGSEGESNYEYGGNDHGQSKDGSAAVDAALSGVEADYGQRGYESGLGTSGSANAADMEGNGEEGNYGQGDYGSKLEARGSANAVAMEGNGGEGDYGQRRYESGLGPSGLANAAVMEGNGEGDYDKRDNGSGVGTGESANAVAMEGNLGEGDYDQGDYGSGVGTGRSTIESGTGGEDNSPIDYALGEGENRPAAETGKEGYYSRGPYSLGRRGYRLAAAVVGSKEEGINVRRGYVPRRGRYRIAATTENSAGGSYSSGGYGPEWREGGSIGGAVE